MNARELLTADFTRLLPGYRVVRVQRNPGKIDRPTVILKQKALAPEPAAPTSYLRVTYVATIATPFEDIERAEDDLDDLVADLVRALDEIPYLVFESAEKVALSEKTLAYDFTVYTLTPKE